MTATINSDDELQLKNVLIHLAGNKTGPNTGAVCTPAADSMLPTHGTHIAQLEAELATLRERLLQQNSEVLELRQKLAASDSGASKKSTAANPFDMVLTLSSEREAALRERKLYKDRAINAETNLAQLESDLAAANANAKLQMERANKLVARHDELQHRMSALEGQRLAQAQRIAHLESSLSVHQSAVNEDAAGSLRRLLQERDKRIRELEMQLTEGTGTPTLFGGEVERLTSGAPSKVVYTLESLDRPGEVHMLRHPVNTIGRSTSNDLALDSPSISRFHARLMNKPEGMWLVDLQSVNGCHINGQRISSQVLSEGDLVLIGECRFTFSTVKQSQSASLLTS